MDIESGSPEVEIYNFWRKVMQIEHTTLLTTHKKSLISARLNDGFTVKELKQAIVNCSRCDWNMGLNQDGFKRNDVIFILRSIERVEMFLNQVNQKNPIKNFIQMESEEKETAQDFTLSLVINDSEEVDKF